MLPLIFACIIGFIIIVYVILDGFDLGLGILFPFTHDEEERDTLMNSVAPIWDGNETWLVFGGAMLYGAFPLAYGTILPQLYMPLMLMILSLVFRGVSFEFRFKAIKTKHIWNWCFAIGSTSATFFQGIVIGAFVQGLDQTPVIWLTPFSLFTGVALVFGYALLGALWSNIKTEGQLQLKMRGYAQQLIIPVGLSLIGISLWTPLQDPSIFQRWFSFPNILYLSPLPLITTILCVLTWRSIGRGEERPPFIYSIGIFLCSYAGIGISMYPYIVPPHITIWQAAAPETTLIFILCAVVVLIPVLLSYTAYNYYIFRGKTKGNYH